MGDLPDLDGHPDDEEIQGNPQKQAIREKLTQNYISKPQLTEYSLFSSKNAFFHDFVDKNQFLVRKDNIRRHSLSNSYQQLTCFSQLICQSRFLTLRQLSLACGLVLTLPIM